MSEIIDTLKNKQNFHAEKGATLTQIEQAENLLGLKFAQDFKEYLGEFGAVSFDGHEFTGFSIDAYLDIVKVTKTCRLKNISVCNLYVIEEAHIDGIIIWQDSNGTVYQTAPNCEPKIIANSLLEYINL